jgi:hypothetical protein
MRNHALSQALSNVPNILSSLGGGLLGIDDLAKEAGHLLVRSIPHELEFHMGSECMHMQRGDGVFVPVKTSILISPGCKKKFDQCVQMRTHERWSKHVFFPQNCYKENDSGF